MFINPSHGHNSSLMPCHKLSGLTDTEDTVGASEWFKSYSLGSLLLWSSSASLGDMNTLQIAFAEMPLPCSTVPNWPAGANNKWDLHTVTSAIAGFALHIGHTFLMIKAVKFTEHLLLVERKKTSFFFFLYWCFCWDLLLMGLSDGCHLPVTFQEFV